MICQFLNRQLRFVARFVLRLLYKSVSRIMGCFLACFRDRADSSNRSRSTERVESRNPLSYPFLDEENGESGFHERGAVCLDSPQALRDEANILKAWGTIPETPVEIRKACEKLKRSPSCNGDSESSKTHPWLQSEEKIDQFSTAIEIYDELETSGSSEETPSSCISIAASVSEGNEAMISDAAPEIVYTSQTDFDKTPITAANVPGKTKSVRFDVSSSSNGSSSGNGSQSSRKFETPGNQSVTKPFPHPTPLKLSDEMQTPGTVYPSNQDAVANGKHRIRSQYVYSVPNPVDKERSGDLEDSFEELDTTATPKPEAGGELSLSYWLKPRPEAQNEEVPQFGRTPGDRPIIGMVAAHWNDNETANIPSWNGNGIPNTTTKYKEDQKVSWHATPFEERLEKVLSAENGVPQRKHGYPTPIAFDEADDADTASSNSNSP